jgi:hypothetical protein
LIKRGFWQTLKRFQLSVCLMNQVILLGVFSVWS